MGIEIDAKDMGGTSTTPVHLTSVDISRSSKAPNSIPAFVFCSALNLISVTGASVVASSFFEQAATPNTRHNTANLINLFISNDGLTGDNRLVVGVDFLNITFANLPSLLRILQHLDVFDFSLLIRFQRGLL